MKNLFSSLLVTAVLAVSASAATISFYDENEADSIFGPSPLLQSYTGEFTIGGAGDGKGYSSALHTLSDVTIVFTFTDALFNESLTVTMTGFSEGIVNLPNLDSTPFTFVLGSGSTWDDLADDGSLFYTITRNSGAFALTNARLDATATVNSVPDSASVLSLLGLGLIGLAGTRRFVRR